MFGEVGSACPVEGADESVDPGLVVEGVAVDGDPLVGFAPADGEVWLVAFGAGFGPEVFFRHLALVSDPSRVLVVCVVLDVDGRVFGLVVGGHFFGGVGVVVVPLVEEFCACHVDVVVCPGFAAGVAEEFDVHDAHRLFLIRCSVRRMSMIRYTGRFHWSSPVGWMIPRRFQS